MGLFLVLDYGIPTLIVMPEADGVFCRLYCCLIDRWLSFPLLMMVAANMPFREIALPVCDVSRTPNGTYCCIARGKHVPSYGVYNSLSSHFLCTYLFLSGDVPLLVPVLFRIVYYRYDKFSITHFILFTLRNIRIYYRTRTYQTSYSSRTSSDTTSTVS